MNLKSAFAILEPFNKTVFLLIHCICINQEASGKCIIAAVHNLSLYITYPIMKVSKEKLQGHHEYKWTT